MKIVFFGSSKHVLPILQVLRDNFNLVLVVTTEKTESDPVISFCETNKISYLSVSSLSDVTIRLALKGASSAYTLNAKRCPLAVLAYFGLIVPAQILNLFPKGIINIHPSLLPKYRGPTPGQAAILNGDKKTGVTIILLDKEIDHGPILRQAQEKILPTDTAETLYERLFKIGAKLLEQTINQYIKGEIKLSPQDHRKATFTKSLTRQDGYIDMSSLEIGNWKLEIARKIRAFYPWPGVWTRTIINNKSSIVKFLPGKKIQAEGRKPMTYKDFINGYPEAKEIISLLT